MSNKTIGEKVQSLLKAINADERSQVKVDVLNIIDKDNHNTGVVLAINADTIIHIEYCHLYEEPARVSLIINGRSSNFERKL